MGCVIVVPYMMYPGFIGTAQIYIVLCDDSFDTPTHHDTNWIILLDYTPLIHLLIPFPALDITQPSGRFTSRQLSVLFATTNLDGL